LKARLLTERDIKEEKGKHHPYVAFRRRVEKMTTRKNRKNDEQAYMSMLKLRSSFEAVVKLTNLIKLRETTKASWLECSQAIFRTRCESKADDETLSTIQSSNTSLSNNHTRSLLKTSSLMNSNSNLISTQHQQLLSQLMRIENQKKNHLSTSTLASLLQTPIQSRSLSFDSNDPFQQKIKRFKGSHKKTNHTDKLTQLLSSPTTTLSPNVHSSSLTPQSIFERLSPSNVVYSPSQQQAGRRRLKNSLSGTIKQGKNQRNLSAADLWSLADSTPGGAILLKAQLLEAARKLQQKEELENNINRRVILQDGSAVLSNTNENLNSRLDGIGTSIDDEESIDPWQFRPKHGCRYLRPIEQDQQQQQQRVPVHRSSFSSFHSLACSERGHLGKRRIRVGRGGRLLYDRHIEQENNDSMIEPISYSSTIKSYFTDKPVLWDLSSQSSLTESYRLHSHLTVHDHTKSLIRHYQSKSSNSIYLNDSFYHVNNFNSSLSLNTGGKQKSSELIEFNPLYSCSSDRVNQALNTLIEPRPPSPSTSPPLPSTNPISTSQQIMLISTPPTPPPSSTMINNNEIDTSQQQQQQPFYTKSSSTYVLSPSTPYYQSHVVPSTSPPPPSSPTSCALVQFVQLHRIHPSTKTHNFASSTPVTTFDS
jgi:hypothetical protein